MQAAAAKLPDAAPTSPAQCVQSHETTEKCPRISAFLSSFLAVVARPDVETDPIPHLLPLALHVAIFTGCVLSCPTRPFFLLRSREGALMLAFCASNHLIKSLNATPRGAVMVDYFLKFV